MGETRSLVVDLSPGGEACVDLVRGAVSDASDWDLLLEGYTVRGNGGVSGKGQAGTVLVSGVYKVRLTGYYGPAGESRHITFRYVKLQG